MATSMRRDVVGSSRQNPDLRMKIILKRDHFANHATPFLGFPLDHGSAHAE
jgi:hypothetical protein